MRVLTAQTSCITSLAFSPDGMQLAAGTEDGTVAVYDLGSARRCEQTRALRAMRTLVVTGWGMGWARRGEAACASQSTWRGTAAAMATAVRRLLRTC